MERGRKRMSGEREKKIKSINQTELCLHLIDCKYNFSLKI